MPIMISSSDISVVVQGPVRKETEECLVSVRRHLAGSEIIFSTWVEEKTAGLEFDRLVINDMPSACVQNIQTGAVNNLNRLIRSTKAGIVLCERPYILKIRSDLILDSPRFLDTFETFPERGLRSVFSKKVLVPVVYSRTGHRGHRTPFHVSDWAAFGCRDDLRRFYLGLEEVSEPQFSQYFLGRENVTPYGHTLFQMAPEQYQVWSLFQSYFDDVIMDDCSQNTEEINRASDEFIVSNFIIAPYSDTGWRLPKYEFSIDEFSIGQEYFELWTKYIYELKYKKIIDLNYQITDNVSLNIFRWRDAYEGLFRLIKHVNRLSQAKKITKKIEQIFIIPAIMIYAIFKLCRGILEKDPQKNANRF